MLQEKVRTGNLTFMRHQISEGHILGKNSSVNTKFKGLCLKKSQRWVGKEWEWFISIPAFYFCPLITSRKPPNEPETFNLFPIAIRHVKIPKHNSFHMLNYTDLNIQCFLHIS